MKILLSILTTAFIGLQYWISKQKRKDNLFKIRYEFYQEVVKAIQNFEPTFVRKAQTIGKNAILLDESVEVKKKNDLKIRTGINRFFKSSQEYFWEKKNHYKFCAIKNNIVFKAECLFNKQFVDFLKDYFSEENLIKEIKLYYQNIYDEFGEDYFIENLRNGKISLIKWFPDKIFQDQFKKDLKLK